MYHYSAETDGHGTLTRYVKLRVAHAPGMPGRFAPPPRVSDPDMHHGTCVTHVPWCMSGSLTSGFLWSRWHGKHFRPSRRMHNPQSYVSGKRPMVVHVFVVMICLVDIAYRNSNEMCTRFRCGLFRYSYIIGLLSMLVSCNVFTHSLQWYFPSTGTIVGLLRC